MSALRTWFRSAPASAKGSVEPSPAVSASASSTALSAEKPSSSSRPYTRPKDPRTKQEIEMAREIADLDDAMALTSLLLNDDIDGAEAQLRARKDTAKKVVSPFHLMGLGVSTFIRSVLGFEKEIMNEADARLTECETRAWEEMRKAQTANGGGGWFGAASSASTGTAAAESIYPPGSEYALVHAESQIMLAVVAELHESLTEAIRGFYKLRKAFVTLNAIIESEEAFLNGQRPGTASATSALASMRRLSFSEDPMPGAFDDAEFADLEAEARSEEQNIKESKEREEEKENKENEENEKPTNIAPSIRSTKLSEKTPSINGTVKGGSINGNSHAMATRGARQHVLDNLANPLDVFIHSGANMCFGLLLLIISMVPPAFSRLLSIVGFKGDRERGVRMLWQSTKFSNINGGMAGLVLLAYYNGLIAYSDILPSEPDIREFATEGEVVGYPKERCAALLAHMRTLYPDSQLWQLEEARLLATDRRAKDAINMIQDFTSKKQAKMRQITAITKFELALDATCAMEWALMRDSFLACVELNNWSHALYYYNIGCAEVELYRTAVTTVSKLKADNADKDTLNAAQTAVQKHKKAAEKHLRKAPTMAGKKKFMARQMPFDMFVIRKLARWEERAAALKIDLADAVGVSPAIEMAFLWNGSKRLSDDLLAQALTYLAWDRCTAPETAVEDMKKMPDEAGIMSLCRANLLRSLGRLDEAKTVLESEILVHDKVLFKGPTKDDYIPAAATYELAVVLWEEALLVGNTDKDVYKTKVDDCAVLLDKVAKWEAFVLDARIGMKLQTGLDTIRWVKAKKGYA
ncbi:mitochondrial outer membrane protein iml2 [Ophiostoma piceae UAMH 11346]|uniref:Inclusion body clearance protein IML2 n=1 Tax=Ophiostoma piceae (strain UAMH 11346) TaxID=1262450 RepID=S3C8B8_OPHP1|nr:mitochondrial outer membrane protein iml2 [Ophiostoma piceae UAMH 11346]